MTTTVENDFRAGEKKAQMTGSPELSKVVPASQIERENDQETNGLKGVLKDATDYIRSFRWCAGVEESFLGIGIARVIGVFLFRIRPAQEQVDDWVWVIVGDLPYAYITTENAPNPATALDAYIGAMEEWVDAAKVGRSVADLIPVNVEPSPEYAGMLEGRLQFLDREILSLYTDDLQESWFGHGQCSKSTRR